MQLFQAFTKFIILISLSAWISACGGGSGSSAFTSWGMVRLIETAVGNAFDPQIISSPAYF